MADSYRDKVAAWEKVAAGPASASLIGPGGMAMWGLGETLGGIGGPQADTWGYLINRELHDGPLGLLTRVKADEEMAKKLVGSFADKTTDMISDAMSSAASSYKEKFVNSPMRHAILGQLKREDDIIAMADPTSTLEAYHTMKKVAPTLSTDKNAVKSFLREAVQHQGGVDYMTLKGLADAEAAVTGAAYKGRR
jgi:hypothetical protein